MYASIQSTIVVMRLRKPIRKKMCTSSHVHHATKPDRRIPPGKTATAALRPIVAKRSAVAITKRSRQCRIVDLPLYTSRIARATYAPICLAAYATPGTCLPSCVTDARSPITNIDSASGQLQRRRYQNAAPPIVRAGQGFERAPWPALRPPTAPCARLFARCCPSPALIVTPSAVDVR